MSCAGCACNFCANSVELGPLYWTAGECSFPCFTCDECRYYDGDWKKRTMRRDGCAHFKEPEKRIQRQKEAAEWEARQRRSMFRVIKGGREEKRG